jgi:hypothetical protein
MRPVRTATGLHSLAHVPASFSQLGALTQLAIEGASALEEIPDSIGQLTNLRILKTAFCHK